MNNKELFNAINDIDEKFITDAGKYLKNDFGGSREGEPIEIRPVETHFSPIRWIAPIAAALALFVGIGVALRTGMININFQPLRQRSSGEAASAPDIGSAQNAISAPGASGGESSGEAQVIQSEVSNIKEELSDSLPFMLYGPDLKQIKYSEVTKVIGLDDSDLSVTRELTEENWYAIECDGFAYINEPKGANYNSIEIPGMFSDDVHFSDNGNFSRIYKGDSFGTLTVSDAYCLFKKHSIDIADAEDEWKAQLISSPALMLNQCRVSFSGEISAEGFIIKDQSGSYKFVMCGGERQIPAMNFVVNTENGTFTTQMAYDNINGYQYMGEIPSIEIGEIDPKWKIDNYYPGRNWQKVLITLEDIQVLYCLSQNDVTDRNVYRKVYTVAAKVKNIVPDYVFGYNDNDQPYFTEDEIRYMIDKAETIEELNDLGDKIKRANYAVVYFRVFYPVDTENGTETEVLDYGELAPGMMVYLYDESGEVIQTFEYRSDLM